MQRSSRFGKLKAIPVDQTEGEQAKIHSYAEMVKNGRTENFNQDTWNRGKKDRVSVMIHNIPNNAQSKAIWRFFNKDKLVLDIILLRRRDINNYRIGFMLVQNINHAKRLINQFNGASFMGYKLLIKFSNKVAKPNTNPNKNNLSSSNRRPNPVHKEKRPEPAQ